MSRDFDLQALVAGGIISPERAAELREEMRQRERRKILEQHPYAIFQNKRGYWITEVNDPSTKRGRRQIARKSREKLEDYLISRITALQTMGRDYGEPITIKEIWNVCRERLVEKGLQMSTINRYDSDFSRYYKDQGWDQRFISDISADDFIEWMEDTCGRLKLDTKRVSGFKLITKYILKRARRDKQINYTYQDVFSGLDVNPTKRHRDPSSQIFTKPELRTLIDHLENHPDVHNLCILFMILTGVRVGEMVTIRFSDFITETAFEVSHTMSRWRDENKKYHYKERDAPKTEAGFRIAFLPTQYSWVIDELRRLRPFATYLATNDTGRQMSTESLRKRLYRVCDKCGILHKSPHKGRKTYGTIIMDAGFDDNLVTSLMGHTDIQTSENHYHYDRKSLEEKQKRIDNILEFKLRQDA